MRNMSFMLTADQIRLETKVETRRLGWKFATVGMMAMPVLKGQGLSAGQKVLCLRNAPIRFTELRWEPLNAITPEAVEREGFPGKTPEGFVQMFLSHNNLKDPATPVHVITFEYLYLCVRRGGRYELNMCSF